MAEELTLEQRRAVEDRGGKLLVSAAAGSGKTKVLVDRLLGYILNPVQPANIDDFLIITYTKAAAAELRGKIAAKLSERIAEQPENRHLQRQMQRLYLAKISTVHAFCTDLLREFAYELDISGDFRVADESECVVLRQQVMDRVLDEAYARGGENPAFRAFVDTQGLGRNDRLVPEIVQKVYDSAQCHRDPELWLEGCLKALDLEANRDAADNPWGSYLLEDLHSYLDGQIRAMEAAAELADTDPALVKVSTLLRSTLVSLRELRDTQSWDQVVRRKNIDYGRLNFPRKYEDPELAARIKAVRDGCKEGLAKRLKIFADPSETVLEDLRNTRLPVVGLIGLVRDFSLQYGKMKKQRRCVDFSDLEHRALDLLLGKQRSGPTRIAREVGSRFREVLVDEYQDSNAVQDAIFEALTREKQNCFMVGDVKQSIYRFRLADPGIFLEKYNTYAPAGEAGDGQGRKIMLSRNFRSGGAVLEAVNDVFRLCMSKKVGDLDYTDREALVEGLPHEALGGPETELHVIQTQENSYIEEAGFVADRIEQLLDGSHMVRGKNGLRPIEAQDIVILLRSPGSVGRYYLEALAAKKIRCAFSGGRNLLETGEISLLRALLQVISNPRQDIPLLSVLASPVFGFSADDLALLRTRNRNGELYDALTEFDHPKAEAFLKILAHLRTQARLVPLAKLVEEIFLLTHMDAIYAAMEDGVERSANLLAFFKIAVEFESGSRRDLEQFLDYLDSMEESGLTLADAQTGGSVTIMSIHKSKGLEFPVVFLCGLARSFNQEDLRAQVLCDKDLGLGLSVIDAVNRVRYPSLAKRALVTNAMAQSLSEELRVLYVAMTRARDRLIMTYSGTSVEKELGLMARRLELCGPELLASQVSCAGEWVLLEAMRRTEAGALFALAGAQVSETHLAQYPWLIQVHNGNSAAVEFAQQEKEQTRFPDDGLQRMRQGLSFRYPHESATQAPSKQTATQLKGREKDQEAAEQTRPGRLTRSWRKPLSGRETGGREYGTAMHTLMQYIDFSACGSRSEIEGQVNDLILRGLLTPEEGEKIRIGQVETLFASDLGKRLRMGSNVLREFKFSILQDAGSFGQDLEGEKILLQGVVDCALIEESGITIVDFKTDRVDENTLAGTVERYRPQVKAYADAMERIYGRKVVEMILYFFCTGQAIVLAD